MVDRNKGRVRIVDVKGSLDLDEVLCRPLFAHLATSSDKGARESPVWFLWEDGALWIIANERTDTFPARVRREPRCAIGIVDFDKASGLVHHVGIRGRAEVTAFDPARARRLLRCYLGDDESVWDQCFRNTVTNFGGDDVLVRFEPETVVIRDQSYAGRPRE